MIINNPKRIAKFTEVKVHWIVNLSVIIGLTLLFCECVRFIINL